MNKKYKCSFCGEQDKSKFYGSKNTRCSICHNKDVIKRSREKKKFVVDHLGGKCNNCEYSRCIQALEVHHLDPNIKDVDFRHLTSWSISRIIEEIKSCVLLCANCHRETHSKGIN